jgi:hypothetical protein
MVEIRCPADCAYLKSAEAHPPARVQRQHDRDVALLGPVLQGLTRRQTEVFFVIGTFLSNYRPDGFERLLDADLAEGVGALAATYETALKGVIYEHRAASLPAQRLTTDLRAFLTGIGPRAGSAFERDAAAALRGLERGARETSTGPGSGDRAFLDLLGRLMHGATAGREEPAQPSPIITGV